MKCRDCGSRNIGEAMFLFEWSETDEDGNTRVRAIPIQRVTKYQYNPKGRKLVLTLEKRATVEQEEVILVGDAADHVRGALKAYEVEW